MPTACYIRGTRVNSFADRETEVVKPRMLPSNGRYRTALLPSSDRLRPAGQGPLQTVGRPERCPEESTTSSGRSCHSERYSESHPRRRCGSAIRRARKSNGGSKAALRRRRVIGQELDRQPAVRRRSFEHGCNLCMPVAGEPAADGCDLELEVRPSRCKDDKAVDAGSDLLQRKGVERAIGPLPLSGDCVGIALQAFASVVLLAREEGSTLSVPARRVAAEDEDRHVMAAPEVAWLGVGRRDRPPSPN